MIRGAIHRPIAISMLFMALVLIGVLSYRRLPVDLLPAINYPRLTIITTYEDVPAGELERLVTQPLEEVVTALSGVRSVMSRTREGISAITVEYEWGTQMDFANLHLREAIDRVAYRDDFPEDAEAPLILRWDPTSRPISVLVLEGEGRQEQLSDFAREVVKPALEQVDGISQAEVVGAAEREIRVEPDAEKLALYGIDLEDIRAALARSNVTFPGGRVRQGPLYLSLRIAGEFESLDQIAATDVAQRGGRNVRISDVARVFEGVKEPEGYTLLGDGQVVSILLYKEPDANTLQVAAEVDRALDVLSEGYRDFDYRFVYRDAEYVQASFSGLVQSLVIGAILAFLVLFLFLRDMRSPLVVGAAIPVSIFITFALLYFGKVKLNLMSLGGLSLAAGMLVDNAIVVLENITRHLEARRPDGAPDADGMARRRRVAQAAELGGREMARPVVAATLTTVAVFFPVVYVPGIAGAFFRDQALTVTFSLLVSIAAALLLQPMLAARILAARRGEPRGLFRLSERAFNAFNDRYHRALARALGHPRRMLLILVLALAAVALLGARLPRGFMPEQSSTNLRLELELPAGAALEETRRVTGDLGAWLAENPDVRSVFSQVGRTERTLAALRDYTAPNTARMTIILQSGRDGRQRAERVMDAVHARLAGVPGLAFQFRDEGIGLAELLGSGGAPFNLGVVAEDPSLAAAVAEDLERRLAAVPGLVDLKVDRVLGTPNLVARLDREEILRCGLSAEQITRELRDRVSGVVATTFNEVEQRVDIAVRLPYDERRNLTTALAAPMPVAGNRNVPLGSFLRFEEERPLRELLRRNQRRMVTITGDLRGRGLDEVWRDAMAVAAAGTLPEGVELLQAGEQEAMRSSFRDLGWAMILAILLVYMILAAQFESFLDPLLIAVVLPIGLAGAIIAIAVTGNSLNILSLIGALVLLGIAVNDAIVKVDTIRRLREEGMEGHAAVMAASRIRLRPILMTSVTTVLAMLPMAIGMGSGEQLQRPLAVTIIGGLSLTTALTLFYTPILYEIGHRLGPGRRGGTRP
ncbi:MAG: efflux RND transporter permease subunit [Candidatus Krumholzibacteriota bacterium]|nr:efflux RND transporter permease subunit [Candidatus Krumholzibacteriota bacterium]